MEFPVFQFVPTAPCLSPRRAWLYLLYSFPSGMCPHWQDPSLPSQLQAEQSQHSQPLLTRQMLQSLNHPHGSSLDSLQHVHVFIVLGNPELDTALQLSSQWCRVDRKNHLSQQLTTPLLTQPTMPQAFVMRAHCWPRSFSVKLLSRQLASSTYWCMELLLSRCRTPHFPLLHFFRFMLATFSSQKVPHTSTTPPRLLSSENLLRVQSALSPRFLKKILTSTSPSVKLRCKPLVTGLQPDFAPVIRTLKPSSSPSFQSISLSTF